MDNKSLEYLKKRKMDGTLPNNHWLILSDLGNVGIADFWEAYRIKENNPNLNEIILAGYKFYDKDVNIKIISCEEADFENFVMAEHFDEDYVTYAAIIKLYDINCVNEFMSLEDIEKLKSGDYDILYEISDIIRTQIPYEKTYKAEFSFKGYGNYAFIPYKYRLLKKSA